MGLGDFYSGEKKKKKKKAGNNQQTFSTAPVFKPPTVIPKGKIKY